MDDRKSYATSIAIGAPIEGEAVGVIIESGHPGWPKGTIVTARTGWRTHTIVPTEGLRWINPAAAPVTTAFGVLGMPGFTAYADLKEIGQQKAGDMLVVAAASGPVGSFVSQLHIEPVPAR